jgi:glucose-6-phosphate dehydrogenase assembly protein OpcA
VGAALAEQWREVAVALSAAGDTSPPWHVHVATTIVHAGRVATPGFESDLDALAGAAPGRLLVVLDEPDRPAGIAGEVAISCTPHPVSGVLLCQERVTLRRGGGAGGLKSVLLALRIPDVPTGLWWLGEPPWESREWEDLARGGLADTVLVDSARFSAPAAGLARLSAAVRAGLPARDLNWSRTRGWREVIAGCFDHPERARWLTSLSAIHVASATNPAAAALVAAWIGLRLDLGAAPRRRGLESAQGRRVQVEFDDQDARPAGLRAVRLAFGGRSEEVVVDLSEDPSCARAVVTGGGPFAGERTTQLPQESDGALAGRELTGGRGPARAAELYALAATLLEGP